MTEQEIKNALIAVSGDESSDEFERGIDKIAFHALNRLSESEMMEFEKNLVKILESNEDSANDTERLLAFKALFCLHIIYRHLYDRHCSRRANRLNDSAKVYKQKLIDLTDLNLQKFAHFNTAEHLRLAKILVLASNDEEKISEEIIDRAKKSALDNKHSGKLHLVATIILRYCEQNGHLISEDEYRKKLSDAMNCIVSSIGIMAFSKSYQTKARIFEKLAKLHLKNNDRENASKLFAEAIGEIGRAINGEDSTNVMRVSRYNKTMSELFTQKHECDASLQQEKTQHQIRESATRSHQIFGIFIGLSTLLVSSINFFIRLKPYHAFTLMLGLFGVLLCAVSCFGFIASFDIEREERRRFVKSCAKKRFKEEISKQKLGTEFDKEGKGGLQTATNVGLRQIKANYRESLKNSLQPRYLTHNIVPLVLGLLFIVAAVAILFLCFDKDSESTVQLSSKIIAFFR